MKINICIVGHGKWGKIILDNILLNKNYNLLILITKQKVLKKNIPKKVTIISDYKKIVKFKNIKAAFIATSPEKQIKISQFFLKNNISLILEKPISTNMLSINKLIEINKIYKKLIIVNYIYLHHPLISHLKKKLLRSKEKISHIETIGGDNKPERKFISTLFDWGPHDLSILLYFIKNPIINNINFKKNFRRINYKIKLQSKENSISSICFGNNFKFKTRKIKIFTDKNFYELNLISNTIFDKNKKKLKIKFIDSPIQNMLNYFYNNFKNKKIINKDLIFSKYITNILLAVQKKIV